MRILSLHPKSWIGEYGMLCRLRDMGHEVCVLEEMRNLPEGARWQAAFHREPGDGLATLWYDPRRGAEKVLTWPFDRIFRHAFDGRNLAHRMWIIRNAVRHFRPEVVFCSDGFSYALPAAFLKRMGLLPARLVTSFIGGDILDCPQADYGKRRTWLTDRLIKASLVSPDILRPVSPMLELVLLRDGAAKERVHVLPSHLAFSQASLDMVRQRRAELGKALRERHGIAQDSPLIISLSNNHKGKGIDVLARAWSRVAAERPDARWLLCGPRHSATDAAILDIVEARNLAHTLIRVGELRGMEVFEHLAGADLNVNPSLCEGLNMVTVEAAAVGTPTVSSDGAGVADFILRHEAGLVTPAAEDGPLADAILRAFQDRAELDRWAHNAEIMSREFTLERTAERLLRLLGSRPA